MKEHESSSEPPSDENYYEPILPPEGWLMAYDPEFVELMAPDKQILFRDGNAWASEQQLALEALRERYANRELANWAEPPSSESGTEQG